MVNWKSKYLKYKLKYQKIKGGMESSQAVSETEYTPRLPSNQLAFMFALRRDRAHERFPRAHRR